MPLRDAGGAIVLRSTESDYWVATLWVSYEPILGGLEELYMLTTLSFWTNSPSRVLLVHASWLLELDSDDKHDASMALSL